MASITAMPAKRCSGDVDDAAAAVLAKALAGPISVSSFGFEQLKVSDKSRQLMMEALAANRKFSKALFSQE